MIHVMTKLQIALDIDGCLFPWEEGVREALIEVHGRHELADIDMMGTNWNHVRDVIGDEHWQWIFSAEGVNHTLDRPHLSFPGVTEALHALSEVADLTYITHRSPTCAAATAKWLASHGAPFRSLHCLGNDDGNHTPKSVLATGFSLFIEDSPTNVMELLYQTPGSGMVVMCPARPYNEKLREEAAGFIQSGRLVMYDHIDEVVAKARELAV